MSNKRNIKEKKTISINPKINLQFRDECKKRSLSMSGLIETWITRQLDKWGVCPEDKSISNYEKIEVKNAKP